MIVCVCRNISDKNKDYETLLKLVKASDVQCGKCIAGVQKQCCVKNDTKEK
jgi:hypothetical protein